MAAPLYLTKNEQALFATLPETARASVTVMDEALTFADTAAHREARMRNLKLEHPALKKIQKESKDKQYTKEDMVTMAESIDLTSLSQPDLIELAFAWGPEVFSAMIAAALPLAQTPADLLELAHLAGIRHGLLLSLNR